VRLRIEPYLAPFSGITRLGAPGFEGAKRLHLGLRIEPRQNRLEEMAYSAAEEQPGPRFASPWSCDNDCRHRSDGRRSLLKSALGPPMTLDNAAKRSSG
jgi:hypothetical protein